MNDNTRIILDKLDEELKNISKKQKDRIDKHKHSSCACQVAYMKIQEHLNHNKFEQVEDEIYFFKRLMPELLCRYIYHLNVYKVEKAIQTKAVSKKRKHLKKQLRRIYKFTKKNLSLYEYFRNHDDHLDKEYFLRNKLNFESDIDVVLFIQDPKIRTKHSHTFGRIMANDLLTLYCEKRLQEIRNKTKTTSLPTPKSALTWTASKIDLVELIYALHCEKVFNNGTEDIKFIAEQFQKLFNINLGNYYDFFYKIKSRKKGKTKFLTKLSKTLTFAIEAENGQIS